jgi:hypothetical protein
MNLSIESQKSIDAYLAALRKQLRDLAEDDARDIVEEIRAHVLDKTSAGSDPEAVAATLAGLGAPAELAASYRTDELLTRAQLNHSPARVLRDVLRLITLSATGLIAFVVSGVGYCVGGMLVVIALLKAFFPRQAGLNIQYDPGRQFLSAGFGAGSGPHAGNDPVGLWLIPICLALGGAILFFTFRFGTWIMRIFRRSRARQYA